MIVDVIKVFVPAVVAFWVGILCTPLLTHYLYKYKAWKKSTGKTALDGTPATEFTRLRNEVHTGTETKTPRMGGVVVWGSVVITAIIFWAFANLAPNLLGTKLAFISRSQTWIPLVTLLVGALVGLLNDILDVVDKSGERGIPLSVRLSVVTLLSLFIGLWFYTKLGIVAIGIPFVETLYLGWLIVPLFILTSLFFYASGVIDGIDGLSGGVFSSIFAAYSFIAFYNGQIDLAAFCATMVGALLAFLWFNVPPARFWMTETGSMAITLTIPAVAFLTDLKGQGNGVFVLPIIGAVLVATVASNIAQVLSKKFRGKKIFRIAPLHHHFEAIGWSPAKVVMRYWILSIVFAITGVAIALVG